MNSERKMMRVFCSREKGAHEVGAVIGTTDGLRLRIAVAVTHPDGDFGTVTSFAAEQAMTDAWCASCSKRLPVVPARLIERAKDGERKARLDAEGLWLDPSGVLERRRQHKG